MGNGQTALSPRDRYLEEIKSHKVYLGSVIKDSQAEYSKQLLSLSSAILAVSVAFLKNLVTVKSAVLFPLLFTAWGLFAGTIFLTLLAIKISIKAHQIYKDDLEKELAGKTDLKGETWRDRLMPKFSWMTTVCFAGGVVCMVVFAVINVQKERTMPDQTYSTPTKHSGMPSSHPQDHVEVQRISPVKEPAPPPPAEKQQQK
jgi:hypothetical protein